MISRSSPAAALLIATAVAGLGAGLTECRSEGGSHDSNPRHSHAPSAASSTLPPKVNPVQNEMRVLHEAARNWVSAVSNNSLDSIHPSIEPIHEARALTEKALQNRAYKPPKNPDDLAGFEKQDEMFHAELVKLLTQAEQKNLAGATKQLVVVLEACTDCHVKYRF